jgi:hypothetical protein
MCAINNPSTLLACAQHTARNLASSIFSFAMYEYGAA